MLTLYVSNDNLLEWTGMTRASDDTYVNDATVTFALKDSADAAVSGGTGTMAYVTASNGNYQGTLESSVTLTVNAEYTLEITASSGTMNGFRRVPCLARYLEAEV